MRLRASARLTQLRFDLQFFKLMLLTVAHLVRFSKGGSLSVRGRRGFVESSTPALPGVEWLRFSGPRGFELRTSCFKSTLHRVTVRNHSAGVISMRFLVFVHCFAHVAGGLPGAMLPKERRLADLAF